MCKPYEQSYLRLDGKLKAVDRCIVSFVLQLNLVGIKTINSCCGHGKDYPLEMSLPKEWEKYLTFTWHSPQTKGRIERTFGTLQDRLIKEMRLERISTQEEANEFLQGFLVRYNERFSKEPLKNENLHRRLPRGIKLRDIFCIKAQRTVTNGYTVRWKGKRFIIETPSIAMRRRKVEVREHFDGREDD